MNCLAVAALAMRRTAAQFGIALWLAAVASAEEPRVSATLAPHATLEPAAPQAPPSTGELPNSHCDAGYCGFDSLQDLWKQDARRRDAPLNLNADTILNERADFAKDVQRFGDPHAPLRLEYKIESLGLCIGGYAANDTPGIRTC